MENWQTDTDTFEKVLKVVESAEGRFSSGCEKKEIANSLGVSEEFLDHIFDCLGAPRNEGRYQCKAVRAVLPILYRGSTSSDPEAIGSGFVLVIDHHHFLCTVAHVTDESNRGNLLMPTQKGLAVIDGQLTHHSTANRQSRGQDKLDIAIVKLTDKIASRLSPEYTTISFDDIEFESEVACGRGLVFVGFPWRNIKLKNNIMDGFRHAYSGYAHATDMYKTLGYSPSRHLIMRYRREKARDGATGQRRTMALPHGSSGGPILIDPPRFAERQVVEELKIVGIGHTYKRTENVIIGTNIYLYLKAISDVYPSIIDVQILG